MKVLLLFLSLCFTISSLSAQIQLGSGIEGEFAEDRIGQQSALSANGQRLIIGAI